MQNNIKNTLNSNRVFVLSFVLLLISFTAISCIDKKAKGTQLAENPPGYDLSKPQKYTMPDILQ